MKDNIAKYNYTLQEIKDRVSYKGLYDLYDQIKEIYNYIETEILPTEKVVADLKKEKL